MQIYLLLMIMALFWHDGASDHAPLLTTGELAAVVIVPKLVLAILYALICTRAKAAIDRRGDGRWIGRLDRVGSVYKAMSLVSYGLDLYLGALLIVRQAMGDFILIDELIIMAPPLLMLMWGWWTYYPIDRRLREATMIRRLDEGGPVYPIWSRRQYLVSQVRHQLALMLVPLLAMLAWIETTIMHVGSELGTWLQLGGVLLIFLFTPPVIRRVWDTQPLPAGELRDMLTAMCRHHRVGVRELLLWRTFGGVINAAVMGFVAPLRYILLTDALLDMLAPRQVEAVMAHELAHVRRHHMFWLLCVAGASSALLQLAWLTGAVMLMDLLGDAPDIQVVRAGAGLIPSWLTDPEMIYYAALAAAILCWLSVFGWVSRRFERQADTFAVQHMVRAHRDHTIVDDESAHAMIAALQQVAVLNHIPIARKSWRHGSIAWRQRYLRSIIGQPVDRLGIDRCVLAIKIAAAIGAVAVLGFLLVETGTLPF